MTVGPYEGVHAFVFIDHVDPGANIKTVVGKLRELQDGENGPVFFASELVGPFVGFAHVAADDLRSLQRLVTDQLWEAGVHSDYAIEGASVGKDTVAPMGPKRASPELMALIRIRVRNGQSKAVLESLPTELGKTFKGASIVFGSYDILLQLGADDLSTLQDAVLGPLQGIEGVARTETSFVDLREQS